MARELTIAYGSLTMGNAPFHLTGKYVEEIVPFSATFRWNVVVLGSSEADFKTQCATLEAAFKARFQTLTITWGAQTQQSFVHASNTGFNHQPFCRKVGGDVDTGRSREYECGVTVELPADDNAGRRSSRVTVDRDASDRRTVTIDVQYTAQGGSSATANYESKFPTFRSSVLSAVGGTYDVPTTVRYAYDDQNKVLDATQVMREILYAQSLAGTDHASIKDAVVEFRRVNPAPEFTPGGIYGDVTRLQDVTATYACAVPHDVTADLHALWTDTIRPYVLSEARRFFGATTTIVMAEEPSLSASGNAVACALRLQILTKGATALAYVVNQVLQSTSGKFVVRRWSGDRFEGYVYQGPARCRRVTTVTSRRVGQGGMGTVQGQSYAAGSGSQNGAALTPEGGPDGSRGWVETEPRTRSVTPLRLGLSDLGEPLFVVDETLTITEEWIHRTQSNPNVTAPSGPAAPPVASTPGESSTPGIAEGAPGPSNGYRDTTQTSGSSQSPFQQQGGVSAVPGPGATYPPGFLGGAMPGVVPGLRTPY